MSTSASFLLTFREDFGSLSEDESKVELGGGREKVKTQMKEDCQRVVMDFTVNCDGSGSLDRSIKMNSLGRGGRFVPVPTKIILGDENTCTPEDWSSS